MNLNGRSPPLLPRSRESRPGRGSLMITTSDTHCRHPSRLNRKTYLRRGPGCQALFETIMGTGRIPALSTPLDVINTLLQRGVTRRTSECQPFQRFSCAVRATLDKAGMRPWGHASPLGRGLGWGRAAQQNQLPKIDLRPSLAVYFRACPHAPTLHAPCSTLLTCRPSRTSPPMADGRRRHPNWRWSARMSHSSPRLAPWRG